ncbi:hypothetical protein JYK14_12160 [Siccirubricoccus sp. KC 17139]|uniref:Uncharacterized protein n=1 Tax=Siccirubricoccus soli TaxID=2899147 RepID=A0ABT1D4R5_9PROT|nr:hypothetical protein [Siccirubricoccus soli]MCO6416908.1 hypothetical protein [Siccirubricoccus soli]MCP2683043.1 hypothetical protein [Siccirubricoccus soli]
MSATSEAKAAFRVSYRPAGEESLVPAGVIAIGAGNIVTVEQAEERFARMLARMAKEVNALSHFTVKTAPPPEAERFTLWGKSVARDAPEAAATLKRLLEQKYGLTLDPV